MARRTKMVEFDANTVAALADGIKHDYATKKRPPSLRSLIEQTPVYIAIKKSLYGEHPLTWDEITARVNETLGTKFKTSTISQTFEMLYREKDKAEYDARKETHAQKKAEAEKRRAEKEAQKAAQKQQ